MVQFERLTGCRPGEVCQLRPIDLDRSGDVWQFRPGQPQDRAPREAGYLHRTQGPGGYPALFVPGCQPPTVSARPKARQAPRGNEGCAGKQGPAFPAEPPQGPARAARHGHATPRTATPARSAAASIRRTRPSSKAQELQIDNPALLAYWAPNRLRHTPGYRSAAAITGWKPRRSILGHAKADVTQVYAERDQALAAEVMKKIG